MSFFAFAAQLPDCLDAQRFQYGFRLFGRAFKIRRDDYINLSTATVWLRRWLHRGGRGEMIRRCKFSYTDRPFIRTNAKVDEERRLSVMMDCFCRLLESGFLSTNERKADIDLCRIYFHFDKAWCTQHPRYCVANFDFEVRARQTFRYPCSRVLARWKNFELFAARPQDRPALYVDVESFEWSSLTSHRLLGVRTPPVLAYYSKLVLRPHWA